MNFDDKIKALNDLAIAWYSTSQADAIHEAIFRGQGLGKFADLCKEEAEEERNLPFTLLSDPEMAAVRAYDVFEEGTRFGRPATVLVRTTYLIDGESTIVQAFGKVKPKQSARQALEALG